jgi:hypothetical protein
MSATFDHHWDTGPVKHVRVKAALTAVPFPGDAWRRSRVRETGATSAAAGRAMCARGDTAEAKLEKREAPAARARPAAMNIR